MHFGLPQGSIVGPSGFSIYTLPLGQIINSFGLYYHMYADDIQLYTTFDPKDPVSINSALSQLSLCIDALKNWMYENFLKLNDEKTEFFVAISPHLQRCMSPAFLRVGYIYIGPSDSIRNLGVIFDTHMSMNAHVRSLCSSLTFHLRNITRIRRFLDVDTCHLVVRSLILSRLDYGNSLFLGCSKSNIQRLQRIQNWAAKLVCQALKYDHATPYLNKLHWLPVEERITFKVLVLVYKCLSNTAPTYLCASLSRYCSLRSNLRSASDTTRLNVPSNIKSLKSTEEKSFFYAAPRMWNSLPVVIRSSSSLSVFRKSLKTYLFSM